MAMTPAMVNTGDLLHSKHTYKDSQSSQADLNSKNHSKRGALEPFLLRMEIKCLLCLCFLDKTIFKFS